MDLEIVLNLTIIGLIIIVSLINFYWSDKLIKKQRGLIDLQNERIELQDKVVNRLNSINIRNEETIDIQKATIAIYKTRETQEALSAYKRRIKYEKAKR